MLPRQYETGEATRESRDTILGQGLWTHSTVVHVHLCMDEPRVPGASVLESIKQAQSTPPGVSSTSTWVTQITSLSHAYKSDIRMRTAPKC